MIVILGTAVKLDIINITSDAEKAIETEIWQWSGQTISLEKLAEKLKSSGMKDKGWMMKDEGWEDWF